MFAGLKNKIKEETGNDVSRISSIVSATSAKVKGRHSRQGSTTSLGSFSIDGVKDEVAPVLDIRLSDGRTLTPKEFKKLETKEDEWRRKLQKKDDDYVAQMKRVEDSWLRKMEEKEKEYQKSLETKDNEARQLLSELKTLQIRNKSLIEEVKIKEEYKAKLCQYQEDLDQLEGFQTQEIAKVKHLLLEKEQILSEKEKDVLRKAEQIEELSAEVRRLQQSNRELHDAEDRLEEYRHKSEHDKSTLTSRLAAEEETTRHLKDRIAVLDARYRSGCAGLGAELTVDETVQGLLAERALLERLLSEAHEHLAEVKTTWSGTISSLETQVGRLCRQASEESEERRIAEKARDELARRMAEMEEHSRRVELESAASEEKLACVAQERDGLVEAVKELEGRLARVEEDAQRVGTTEKTPSEKEDYQSSICKLEQDNQVLTKALHDQKEGSSRLMAEFSKMKEEYDAEKSLTEKLQLDMGRERREKDTMMLRNAEVSQEIELVKQELRSFRQDTSDMQAQIENLQTDLKNKDEELRSEKAEKDELLERIRSKEDEKNEKEVEEMKATVEELRSQLHERNKTVKSLQARINDMKKTLQKEFNVPSRTIDPGGQNGAGIIPAHGPALLTPACPEDVEDVNFKYLKHVVFKFLTSREYEAQHLTRAVATLLRLTTEEERMLKETMDWKASWFGSRPKIGSSPLSRTLPPS